MQELISRICEKTGITPEQAAHAIETVKHFVKEKVPMIAGTIDHLFDKSDAVVPDVPGEPVAASHESILDKISDVIPGAAGEKIEDIAKGIAHKAEDAFDGVKGKIGGLMGGHKI